MSSTVLVVDDETEIRDTVADNFRKRGCTVLTAANGADALRLVNEQKVQAVVTDVRMPRMSGLELLDQLKGLPGDSPAVVLMSGYADVTIDEVYHRGAEALFHKPFSTRLLVDATLGMMAPKDELWGTPPSYVVAIARVEHKFRNLEAATGEKLLRLGRGGMFLSLPEQQFKKEDPLSFHFEFAEGSLTRMVGNGVVRWTRRGAIDGLSPGCGVEFTYLDDASRALFVRMIAGTKARPFIPKG